MTSCAKILTLAVFLCVLLSSSVAGETWSERFNGQIASWIEELSVNDPAFFSWKHSAYTYTVLGPEARQWLVTIKNGKNVGYMVVAETANEAGGKELALLEYGTGEYTLFDKRLLQEAKVKSAALVPVYRGLESIWLGKDQEGVPLMIDGKNGETYPAMFADLSPNRLPLAPQAYVTRHDTLKKAVRSPVSETADVTDEITWLNANKQQKGKGITFSVDPDTAGKMLAKQRFTYVTTLFAENVTAPYIVEGAHQWGDLWFIGLRDRGVRYLSLKLLENGAFVPAS
ncbi:hypothetical protein BSNK01_06200 [Bacillaceae bacterium]